MYTFEMQPLKMQQLRAQAQRILDPNAEADLFSVIHANLSQPAVAFDVAAYMVADTYAKRAAEQAARS